MLDLVKEKWSGEVVPELIPEGDHNSHGSGECGVGLMKGHVRSVKVGLEEKLGCPIPENHNLMTWVVDYAGGSYRRFHVGRDGKCPLERILGRKTYPLWHISARLCGGNL